MRRIEKLTFASSDCEVDLMRECISRGGEETHLRRKSFQVLVYLIENRERLVSKDELIRNVWQNVAVTDDVLVQSVKEIRRSFGDDPHHPTFIKTVPKSGYRFIAEVRSSPDESSVQIETKVTGVPVLPSGRIRYHHYLIALLVVIFSAGGIWIWLRSADAAQLPSINGKRSVAVMFFDNRSNDAELEWLSKGLTDMLIANLSRSEKLTVLSRTQLSAWAESSSSGSAIGITQGLELARKTKAEVLITGGFSLIEDRLRVDVQIYDGSSGALIGSEAITVERPDTIVNEIDLISLNVARRLNAIPETDAGLGVLMTNDLAAYRYYSLGVEKARSLQNKEAIELLEQAVAKDPNFAMAHARIGYTYAVSWGHIDKGKPYLEKAFQLSERLTDKDRLNIAAWYAIANNDFALAIENYRGIVNRFTYDSEARSHLAKLLSGEGRYDEAIAVLREGIAIDPKDKNLYNILGLILSSQGKHAEAIATHQVYVELAPTEPNAYDSLGLSYQWAGDYPLAIENFARALSYGPDFEIARIHLAGARFRIGQYNTAIAELKKYIEVAPSSSEKSRGFDNLSLIYFERGDLISAAKAANAARLANSESLWSSYRVARKRGDVREAERIEKLLGLDLNLVKPERGKRGNLRFNFYYLGVIAFEHRKYDDGIEHFRKALLHPPPTWNIKDFEDCLAEAFLNAGRIDEAIAEYQRVLRVSPSYPLANFHLAQAFRAKGLTTEASNAYQQFLADWAGADAEIPEMLIARRFVTSFIPKN